MTTPTVSTTHRLMAATLRHAADLLERIGGDVHIGTVYTFQPTRVYVQAENMASLELWADALGGAEIISTPYKKTLQHHFDGASGTVTVLGLWIEDVKS